MNSYKRTKSNYMSRTIETQEYSIDNLPIEINSDLEHEIYELKIIEFPGYNIKTHKPDKNYKIHIEGINIAENLKDKIDNKEKFIKKWKLKIKKRLISLLKPTCNHIRLIWIFDPKMLDCCKGLMGQYHYIICNVGVYGWRD